MHESHRSTDIDDVLTACGFERHSVATAPGFSGLPPFMRATTRLADQSTDSQPPST